MTQWSFSNQPISADDAVTPATSAVLLNRIEAADVTLHLVAGGGALLPVPDAFQVAVVRIEHELISYTTNIGDTLGGVTRGYGGTTPAAHASGKQVRNVIPAEYLNYIQQRVTSHNDSILSINATLAGKQSRSEKGQPGGYAALDSFGHVPQSNLLPSIGLFRSGYIDQAVDGTVNDYDYSVNVSSIYYNYPMPGLVPLVRVYRGADGAAITNDTDQWVVTEIGFVANGGASPDQPPDQLTFHIHRVRGTGSGYSIRVHWYILG